MPSAEPYRPWFGWGPEAEPAGDGDGYPQPSFYPGNQGYHPEVGYPRGPGYAPLPPDRTGTRVIRPDLAMYPIRATRMTWATRTGGRAGRDSGYGYPPDPGYERPPEQGYGRDVDDVPPMESLLDAGYASPGYPPTRPPGPVPAGCRRRRPPPTRRTA